MKFAASNRKPASRGGPDVRDGVIPEVEVSITAACTLACAECGFFVPRQPAPVLSDGADATGDMLVQIERAGLRIGSLAVLGGEATLAPQRLHDAVKAAAESAAVDKVELVTNGLTPQGLEERTLPYLNRISLSDYTGDDELAAAWSAWLSWCGPHIEFIVRRHTSWDANDASVDLGVSGGQSAYDRCWFRAHCVTLERGRLFACSRIAKLGRDDEGLALDSGVGADEVLDYLCAPIAPSSCRSCTLMAGLPRVEPGVQPDARLRGLRARALRWFAQQEEKR
jgi:hypothetical protein